jgi:predicted TIM-barrel fold metal-dependent hydrolase
MNPTEDIPSWTETDRQIYDTEIRPWLPDRLFDAHTHLIDNALHPRLAETMPLALDPMLGNIDLPRLEAWWRMLFPEAQVSGLLMAFPTEDVDVAAENAFVARSAEGTPHRFSLMTRPETPAADLEAEVLRWRPAGLKPYLVFARRPDPENAALRDLIPEEQLDVADRHGLAVTLHVAKARGMADPDNLRDIARLVHDFPRCQFILAHCGRCFIAANMEAALEALPVEENLWLDTSAVCDTGVFLHLFRRYDPTRLIFGTDLVTAAGFRGTYTPLGRSWHVITAAQVSGLEARPTFAAYENLRALLLAARHCGWTDRMREDLFYNNAARLFGLAVKETTAL